MYKYILFSLVVITSPMATQVDNGQIESLLQIMREETVTCAMLVAYMLYDILEYSKTHKLDLGKLTTGILSGSTIDSEVLRGSIELIPDLRFVYSLTEFSVTDQPFGAPVKEKVGNVGFPIPNIEVMVTDVNGKPLPIGKPGEIYVRNFQTASLQYVGMDIQAKKTKEGWFRTGDLGTMDSDGLLNVFGRIADSIKRAGILIYPIVIERVMIEHPKVLVVQVVGVPDTRFGEEVCACVVPKTGVVLHESELIDFADEKFLTEGSSDNLGIKPRYFVIMQNFPTTLVGKYDRAKIKERAIQILKNKSLWLNNTHKSLCMKPLGLE